MGDERVGAVDTVTLVMGESQRLTMRVLPEYIKHFKHNRIDVASWEDAAYGDTVYQMTATMLRQPEPQEIVYRTPASWWQHFKMDCFPKWLKKRYPVRERVDTVEIVDLFPFPRQDLSSIVGDSVRIARIATYFGGE